MCGSLHFHRSPRCYSVGFRPTAQFVFLHIPSRTRCWCVAALACQYSSMFALKWIASSYPMFSTPSFPRNTQFTSVSKLKAVSRLSTTAIETQVSAESVVAGSGFGAIGHFVKLSADRARAGDTSHEKVPRHCQLMD